MSRAAEYTAENIRVMSDVDHIRFRPGMYIGNTDVVGLHYLLFDLIDVAIQEVRTGRATQVHVKLRLDGSVEVADDAAVTVPRNRAGRIDWQPSDRSPYQAGSMFPTEWLGYTVVRALSEWSRIEVRSRHRIASHEFRQGVPTGSPTDGGETQETGFSLRFRPDPDIFPDPRFDPARIRERLRQFAFLNSGVPITLTTEHGVERFEYSDGIRGYLGFLAEGRTVLHEPLIARSKAVGIEYELGLQWCEGNDPPLVESFANGSVTRDGGSHIEGLRTGISRAAGRYLRAHRPDVDFKSEDYREGLVGVVSVHLATPRYEFSTKSRLGSSEVRRPVQRAVEALLEGFFERNPAVVETIVLAAQSRIAAKEALQQSRRSMKKQS